ncbi:MAG: DUF3368 domain-containing protein [Pseudomonadota bacterium]
MDVSGNSVKRKRADELRCRGVGKGPGNHQKSMKIISDSSPLMAFSAIGKLPLLQEELGQIIIPDAVWTEIAVDGKHKKGTGDILRADWIKIEYVKNQVLAKSLRKDIDYGESEAIALAVELDADLILLDDKMARTVASNFGLNILGTVGILIRAKKKGLLQQLRPELQNLLVEANFRLSHELINIALREVGENNL